MMHLDWSTTATDGAEGQIIVIEMRGPRDEVDGLRRAIGAKGSEWSVLLGAGGDRIVLKREGSA